MGRLVILTGHTGGLGAALLDALVGAPDTSVVALGRRRVPRTETNLRQIVVDLRSPVDAAHALADALDVADCAGLTQVMLVNNAGVLPPIGPVGSRDVSDLADAVALNLATPIALTNELLRLTTDLDVERRVAQISSGAAATPYAGWATYCATKAGLDQFTRSVALEAPLRCRVCSIAPGVVDTAMQAQIRASNVADFPQHARFVALDRDGMLASPDRTARRLVDHLLSDSFGNPTVIDLRDLAT
jgi:NAD(P)-dependent dehydrogenase (short-subunit alcohol dehydrogenase family)